MRLGWGGGRDDGRTGRERGSGSPAGLGRDRGKQQLERVALGEDRKMRGEVGEVCVCGRGGFKEEGVLKEA